MGGSEPAGCTMASCLKSNASAELVVYQLRVVLRGISPLIWRRLLVRSDSTVADLHATLQTALGWSDEHLNRFVVHAREYGVSHDGGIGFRDDPQEVHLADLGLRVGERFVYEYDFTDGWQGVVKLSRVTTRCSGASRCRWYHQLWFGSPT